MEMEYAAEYLRCDYERRKKSIYAIAQDSKIPVNDCNVLYVVRSFHDMGGFHVFTLAEYRGAHSTARRRIFYSGHFQESK